MSSCMAACEDKKMIEGKRFPANRQLLRRRIGAAQRFPSELNAETDSLTILSHGVNRLPTGSGAWLNFRNRNF